MIKQPKTAEIVKPFGEYKTPGANAYVIKALRETLEQAERGEIFGVAIASINARGYVHIKCEKGSCGMAEIVGAVAILQHDMMINWESIADDAG